ncbi:unnamed protein product [Microthlaspi erraticum]|uniref:Uncharacterized protein n=1 Tax=Microthlaspi erraticum TaxID=1685480 RepID=A0A6D2J4S2_9BRAS|nr:unnamed protein product [Microthlaspi erraticum]
MSLGDSPHGSDGNRWKSPLRAPISLALEMESKGLDGLVWAMILWPPRCMRTRSSRTTEDLVELDFTTEGNGLGRARQPRPIGLGDAPNRHQQRQGIVPPPVRTTTLRSSWV